MQRDHKYFPHKCWITLTGHPISNILSWIKCSDGVLTNKVIITDELEDDTDDNATDDGKPPDLIDRAEYGTSEY